MTAPRPSITVDLHTRIRTGDLPPGTHLAEVALSREYGVSRSPVRAALRELSRRDLVTIEPNRGAFVTQWTTSDTAEIMMLRSLLEAHGAARAARTCTPAQLADIDAACSRMDEVVVTAGPDSRGELDRLNRAFHLAVLSAANAPRLTTLVRGLMEAPPVASYHYYADAHINRSLHDHHLIADAIRHQDASTAHDLMSAHLKVAYTRIAYQESSTEGNPA